MSITPRFIRFRDAPDYVGMDKNRFNAEVRPGLVEIPIGDRGIGFDRLDLDAWADEYKARNGRPSRKPKGIAACEPGRKASKPPKMVEKLSISSTKDGESLPDLGKSARTRQKPGSGKSKAGSTQKVNDLLNVFSSMRASVTS